MIVLPTKPGHLHSRTTKTGEDEEVANGMGVCAKIRHRFEHFTSINYGNAYNNLMSSKYDNPYFTDESINSGSLVG